MNPRVLRALCRPLAASVGLAVLVWPAIAAAQATEAASAVSPAMVALERYIGTWRADDQVGADSRTSHFIYELAWFDGGHTIVEMLILQRFDDGEERVLWKGFKGRAPGSETVYYYGFSPGGRAARGHSEVVGGDFVTEYDGWGPGGPVVRVRDVFSPVVDGAFTGRTLVRATPESEWAQVSSDRWSRVGG
jgi:hypothetical protein